MLPDRCVIEQSVVMTVCAPGNDIMWLWVAKELPCNVIMRPQYAIMCILKMRMCTYNKSNRSSHVVYNHDDVIGGYIKGLHHTAIRGYCSLIL